MYEDVIFVVSHLAQTHTGALIVLERETGLRTFIQSGVALDARLSSDLLVSIFQRAFAASRRRGDYSPGTHPRRGLLSALDHEPGLVATLGSRHRAAIGVTEESDCVTIAVSEINGRISLAIGGRIELDVSLDHIREKLNLYFGRVVAPLAPREASAPTAADSASAPPVPGADSASQS